MSAFIAVCKIDYVPISNPEDEVVPGNLGALRMGLEALQKEDANDFLRAGQLWNGGLKLLADEREDDMGAGATGSIQWNDDFALEQLECGWGYL